MKLNPKSKLLHWAILLVLVFTWGSSFILMKRGLVAFPSMQVGALRITTVFFSIVPFVIHKIKDIPKDKWKYLLIVGLAGNGAPAFLFAYAQTAIDSYLAGILNSLTPLFTLLLGVLFFRVKSTLMKVLGVFIGLGGAIGLISVSGDNTFNFNMGYGIFIVIATICYAINVNVIKTYLNDLKAVHITGFSYIFTGIPCVIFLFLTDFPERIVAQEYGMESFLYILILGVFGTAVALTLFNYLIKLTSALFASSVTYMIPIVAVLWGVFDGEEFKISYFAWIALILIGVYMVNRKKYRKRNAYKE